MILLSLSLMCMDTEERVRCLRFQNHSSFFSLGAERGKKDSLREKQYVILFLEDS